MTEPDVCVLMTVWNGERYVESAVRSVMNQTLGNVEIIVVDDASTDNTPAILARLAGEDERVRVVRLDVNIKQPGASNRGLEVARAPLIARLDADDLSAPTRLEVQKRYLDAHPEVVLVGASVREVNAEGRVIRTNVRPLHAYGARWLGRFVSPIVHSTFMFRARLPSGEAPRYDPAYLVGQDADLMVRMLAEGDVVNLPDVLVDFRFHATSVSVRNRERQQQAGKAISLRRLRVELPAPIVDGLMPLLDALYDRRPPDAAALFAGLRRMVALDAGTAPAERAWVRREAAFLARYAMHKAGMSRRDVLRAFLVSGRDFLPAFALRSLEMKGWLPAFLHADPAIVARPAKAGAAS